MQMEHDLTGKGQGMRHVGMVLLALLLWPPPLLAEIGDLVPVECATEDAVLPRPLYTPAPEASTRPAGASGLVHPKAAVIALANGEGKVMLALDAAKADSAELDVVRFDFSGTGKFSAEQSLPLTKLNIEGVKDHTYWRFGPAKLRAKKGELTFPVTVSGWCQSLGGRLSAGLSATCALEGKCQFGEKSYAVRIIDGGFSLCFSDALPIRLKEGKVSGSQPLQTWCDTVLLDLGGSGFAKGVKKTVFGAPVLVDGKWYELAVSADSKKVSARPVEIQAGQLLIPHEDWWALLVGDKGGFYAAGGKEAIDIPAGDYALMYYEQQLGDGKSAGSLTIVDRASMDEKQSVQVIAIAPGKRQELAIGTPLTASVEGKATEWQERTGIVGGLLQAVGAKGAAKQVQFSMILTDAGGRTVMSFNPAGPTRRPTVKVLDAQGKQIASGKMEFG